MFQDPRNPVVELQGSDFSFPRTGMIATDTVALPIHMAVWQRGVAMPSLVGQHLVTTTEIYLPNLIGPWTRGQDAVPAAIYKLADKGPHKQSILLGTTRRGLKRFVEMPWGAVPSDRQELWEDSGNHTLHTRKSSQPPGEQLPFHCMLAKSNIKFTGDKANISSAYLQTRRLSVGQTPAPDD